MPIGLDKLFKYSSMVCAFLVLAACSRENPLNVPPEFVETPSPYCLQNGPYVYYELLSSIDFTNVDGDIQSDFNLNDAITIDFDVPYLANNTVVRPNLIQDTKLVLNEETNTYESVPAVNNKTLDNNLYSSLISTEELDTLNSYVPHLRSLSVNISYPSNGTISSTEIIDDITDVTADLLHGQNVVNIRVTASIEVPRSTIDCLNSLSQDDIANQTSKDNLKTINYTQTFNVNIDRKDSDAFSATELLSQIDLSVDDSFGKVFAVNENFLVIGLPDEDSGSRGIFGTEFIPDTDSPDSGAIIIYDRQNGASWQFHSIIKPAYGDRNDRFGSAISLYENSLVISAPGESSSSSGVLVSGNNQTNNAKINNSAPNSGAVYFYKYDQNLDAWNESLFIKPENNAVSNATFNRGFGANLALHKGKLLVAATLENSDNGNFSNANKPESGAVYLYSNLDGNGWKFASTIKAINPSSGDKFGSSIALNDNFFAIGAPFEDHSSRVITNNLSGVDLADGFENNSRTNSGAVYIYSHNINSSGFSPLSLIKSSNSDEFDYFGTNLALINNRLFVSAIGEDSKGKGLNREMNDNSLSNSGAVYGYKFNDSSNLWIESSFIKANDSQIGASFGKYLSADLENLFISAPLHDSYAYRDNGKVYYYTLTNNSLAQDSSFEQLGTSDSMRFGSNLQTFGRHLIIGASGFIRKDSGIDEPFVGKVFTYE